jgi:hypothetical protein
VICGDVSCWLLRVVVYPAQGSPPGKFGVVRPLPAPETLVLETNRRRSTAQRTASVCS